jgi:predicted nucleic acid-binding Zn ribbon protein
VAVGDVLRSVLQKMAGSSELRQAEAIVAWELVVGAAVAARTQAERLEGGTLYVRVASSAYANELQMCKQDILRKLGPRVGGAPVTDLRFHVGTLKKTT